MKTDEFVSVDSGHIDAVSYNSMQRRLTVRFKNGSHYHVHDFSPADHDRFMSAPSQGEHYHREIKGNYRIERV
jgi:hypothetical protein